MDQDGAIVLKNMGRKIVSVGLAASLALAGSAFAQTPVQAPAQAAPAQPTAKPEAQLWAYLRFSDGAMAWNLHAGRWSENNTIAEGQRLLWYAKPNVVDGLSIVWAQDFWKIACPASTLQVKSGEELGAGLQTLFTYKPGQPKPIAPNTPDNILKLVYCDNKTIEGVLFADGIIEVMSAMSKPAEKTPQAPAQ